MKLQHLKPLQYFIKRDYGNDPKQLIQVLELASNQLELDGNEALANKVDDLRAVFTLIDQLSND